MIPSRLVLRRRRRGALALLTGAAVVAGAPIAAWSQARSSVLVARVADTITPVIADHLADGVAEAERGGYAAFVVELDTPGGLDTSMRTIVQSFLGARVPVVVFVAPAGARAASAGAIITFAAHVAAMAPGTAIGAATPVDLQGGEIGDKVVNDAAAFAVSVARARGRNTRFAEDAVRKGRSVPADEALKLDVVDLLAPSREQLLERIDGTVVKLERGEATLRTAGAAVVAYDLRGFRRILQLLADPNLAFLFLSLGTLAIIYEVANPGAGLGGALGAIMIVLAMFSLSVLPVNAAGALLLVLGLALFIAEVFTPGVGVFAGGGTLAVLVGGLFLFREGFAVDLAVLLPATLVAAGGAVVITRAAWRTRLAPARSGRESMVGEHGVVRAAEGNEGQIFVAGAWWKARADRPLAVGTRVRVVAVEELELRVEPEEE